MSDHRKVKSGQVRRCVQGGNDFTYVILRLATTLVDNEPVWRVEMLKDENNPHLVGNQTDWLESCIKDDMVVM